MTIQVEIRNNDSARTVEVKVWDFDRGNHRATFPREIVPISPGENRTFYVHLLRELEVSEAKP